MGLKNPAKQDQKLIVFSILSHLSWFDYAHHKHFDFAQGHDPSEEKVLSEAEP